MSQRNPAREACARRAEYPMGAERPIVHTPYALIGPSGKDPPKGLNHWRLLGGGDPSEPTRAPFQLDAWIPSHDGRGGRERTENPR